MRNDLTANCRSPAGDLTTRSDHALQKTEMARTTAFERDTLIQEAGQMRRRRKSFWRTAIGITIGLAACADGARDPSTVMGPSPISASASKSPSIGGSPAISDAISRILPSIDSHSADALRGPLTAVNNELANGNATALGATIKAARNALSAAFANAVDAPDLDVVALAIDSIDPATP
jgi:hypothetical protein